MTVKIEMDMPKSCSDCNFPHTVTHYNKNHWGHIFHLCPLIQIYIDGCTTVRHPECPLKECK